MKKSISFWQLVGFIFTCAAGTLLHFVYDWSGQSVVAALFSAVNESIWEHMKLLFFSMFVYAFAERHFIGRQYKNYWCVKLVGISLGLVVIPVLYYTYTGALGVFADWFNIIIFFLAAAVSFVLETRLLKNERCFCISATASLVVLFLMLLVFVALTFVPPQIPLFMDPRSNMYGLAG